MPITTVRSKPRRPFTRRAGLVCLVGSLAACSSSGTPTASSSSSSTKASTSTSTKTYASVGEFFAHDGKPLLAFERATKVIATGSVPEHDTCQRLTRDVLPKIVPNPNVLSPLARRIPDPTLAAAVDQDVRLKLLVVLGCSSRPITTGPDTDKKAWTSVRDFSNTAKRLLARYGIDV
jgi:hypothetical protein